MNEFESGRSRVEFRSLVVLWSLTLSRPTPSGEMLRMPLDSVILMLKEILNEETTAALLDCLEPPDLSTIERSYNNLYKSNFISHPNDSGEITRLGAFVTALGIDLTLGALIGLGELRWPLR
jgi:HrpA-like RNA helicase